MRYILRSLLFLLVARAASADLIVKYDFTGSPGDQVSEAADVTIANVTASALVRGSGLTATAAGDSISASGWSEGALSSIDYYGFTLTPSAGATLSLVGHGNSKF